jgi:hypothetical protein
MSQRRPDLAGSQIVLLGSFNPSIFHPSWFARQSLMTDAETDVSGASGGAKIQVIHPQVCSFETESFVLSVTTDRFSVGTKPSMPWVPLRDLVLGTFSLLEHTPVTAMGLNRQMHYRMSSEEAWHRLGDRLAPKDGWNGILGGRPGLLTLEILASRPDAPDVRVRTKLQPSTKITPHGVYLETNEHYPAPESEPLRALLGLLQERWEESQNYAERIANHIFDWASRDTTG